MVGVATKVRVVGTGHLYSGPKAMIAASELAQWHQRTVAATWLSSLDVNATHPFAVQVAHQDWEFPLTTGNAVIVALVQFRTGVVLVKEVR